MSGVQMFAFYNLDINMKMNPNLSLYMVILSSSKCYLSISVTYHLYCLEVFYYVSLVYKIF